MKHKHHKIPKHMGGTDDMDNIEELSIEDHAKAHKILYEKYGKWQDRIAWQGLLKLISKKDIIKNVLSESGKKGASISNEKMSKMDVDPRKGKAGSPNFKRGNQITAKTYLLKSPSGEKIKVFGLVKWCKENNLKYQAFWKQVVERKKEHKGWKLWGW